MSLTAKLDRLHAALRALPTSLPLGSAVYNFDKWTPDPNLLEDFGAECSVLNAHLENVFGLRNGSLISLAERGPGLESIVEVFRHYLSGAFAEKPVIEKWLDDLTTAAEHISRDPCVKRISKPSASLKRSNEYVADEKAEKEERKRKKGETKDKAAARAVAILKSAQTCNWPAGFDDLEDLEQTEKVYTTGRRSIAIIDELIIPCKSKSLGKPQRILNHSTEECRFIDPDLRERAAEQCHTLAPGTQVMALDHALNSNTTLSTSTGNGSLQPSVFGSVTTEGRKARQLRFDLALVKFTAAAQLAPNKLDLPEFHSLISVAGAFISPKSSSHIAHSHIPMESARLRREHVSRLRTISHLTISFDGGTARRPQSFTTIHVTTPKTRTAYLMNAVEASGISHTGEYYFDEAHKVIQEIGASMFSGVTCDSAGNTQSARKKIHALYPTILVLPDPCHQLHNAVKAIVQLAYFDEEVWGYFNHSSFATAHLNTTRREMGITQGFDLPGITRFAGWHYGTRSVRINLPAVDCLIETNIIEMKKDHKLLFMRKVVVYSRFKTQLRQLEKVTEPFARAIKCLELGHSNPGDVFLFNMAVMAQLRQIADDNEAELGLPEDTLNNIRTITNARYYNMVLASGQEVYLSTFMLNPQYRNSDILRRNNLNPLRTGTIILRPHEASLDDEIAELARTFPCLNKVGIFLKQVLCRELEAGTLPAAQDFPSTTEGIKLILAAFKSQFIAYIRGEYPFLLPSPIPANFSPRAYWVERKDRPDACFIAPIAVKLFSVVPNSMAEERTVSCFSSLNSKDRSRQKISTLVHMTRIRQDSIRARTKAKFAYKPVVKFCELATTLLQQRSSPQQRSDTPELADNSELDVLADGWSVEDIETIEPCKDISQMDSELDEGEGKGSNITEDENVNEDEELEPTDPRAYEFAADRSYHANLSSEILLNVLSDRVFEDVDNGIVSTRSGISNVEHHSKSSAKKDISGIDLDSPL
ncbi:hypothetical protein RhiJN_27096 [Ceratobasidium sp. AG-Ba]|nr:hypothetical protein RhiJN_27096 [Ceratobasidium sp. AG-Ba]